MYSARQAQVGLVGLGVQASELLSQIQLGALVESPAVRGASQRLDLDNVSGLPAVLTQDQITGLQSLRAGTLAQRDLSGLHDPLRRLALAGLALNYHQSGRPGKVSVTPTVPMRTSVNLTHAYSPGVAYPSRLIAADRSLERLFTNILNSVLITGDGSACLGDGALGPYAFMPIGEGKAALMKLFAGLDAYSVPIDLAARDESFSGIYDRIYRGEFNQATREETALYIDELVKTICSMRVPYGAVNLEDVSNRTCFEVLRQLELKMGRLPWHDDQRGTAMVAVASILNALKVQGKTSPDALRNLKIRCAGAGAGGIATARLLYLALKKLCPDFRRDQIVLRDSRGPITTDRRDWATLSEEKREFAVGPGLTDDNWMDGVDVFIGLSPANTFKVTEEQVRGANVRPIFFGLANPDPEVTPEFVRSIRGDAVCGTGRSDLENQANNSNAFPGTLAGGLDVAATLITDEMSLAGAFAMARVAEAPVSQKLQELVGRELRPSTPGYVTAHAFDFRVHAQVALAVAQAAVNSGISVLSPDQFNPREYLEFLFEGRLQGGIVVPGAMDDLIVMP